MLLTPTGETLSRVLTTSQARQFGYTPGRIRTELSAGRWDQLTRGVYLTTGRMPERGDWLRAGLLIAGPGAVVSGWDGLRAHGLGAQHPPTDEILILTQDGTHRLVGRVRIRPSRRPLRAVRLPVPGACIADVADVARAIADTAHTYRTLPPVRALVLSSAQLGRCTIEQLQDELADGPRNRSAHLRRAIDALLAGAASIAEAELADVLRDAGLPDFEQNIDLIDGRGRLVATADVFWRSLRAVLEVDSREHHFLEPKWEGTMSRHNLLTRHRLAVTHYAPKVLRSRRHEVVRELDDWLRARADELGLPYPPPATPEAERRRPFLLLGDQQARNVV